ncbi:EamA family transporter [Nocardia colli]|uniref:EamA family transporter n=1 Tax=Nocardia colli TaxID=2545717 RepID=A0A5N0E8C8_9NOCA|nr:EamA family transporter [Nocardia colli]KAA8883821.1 EamA family transporter [Nocardia colli]
MDYLRVFRSPDSGALLSTAAGPVLFGTAFLAIEHLPATPLWNAVFRVLPAGSVLIAFRPALPHGVWWLRMVILGVLNFAAFFGCQAIAAHRLPGGVVSTIAAAQCVVVPLVVLAFGRRLGARQFTAPVLGLIGVGLLVLRGGIWTDTTGIVAAAALALLSATGMVLTRRWGVPPSAHPLSAVAWQMLAGGLILVPLAGVFEGGPPSLTLSQLAATAWLSIPATALAFALFFGGLYRGVEPTTASRLMLLGPVVAVALGWVFAAESLTVLQFAGVLLVLAAQFGGLERGGANRVASGSARTDGEHGALADVDGQVRSTVFVGPDTRLDRTE